MSDKNLKCPAHVMCLGYGGLIPFIGLAISLVLDPLHSDAWSNALVGYGAVILSFVGALHWGFAMVAPALDSTQRRRAFVWSVVPALIAWPAIVLAGTPGSVILLVGFVCHLTQDLRLAGPAALPAWYLPLRWRLTVVASICLAVNVGLGVSRG